MIKIYQKISIILILVLAFLVLPVSAATVSIGNFNVGSGGTVTGSMNASDVTNLGSATVNLTFNPSVVIVTGVSEGSGNALGSLIPNINNTTGLIRLNADSTTGKSGDVTIADITFQAVGSAGQSSLLNITIGELVDISYNQISASTSNGTFTIIGGPKLTLTLNTTMDGTSTPLVNNITSAVLLDTSGNPVATATLPDNMTAQFSMSGIIPGDYFIKVNDHAGALVPTRIDSNASDINQSVGRRLRNSIIGSISNPAYRIKSYPSEISSSHPVVNYTTGANETKYAFVIVPGSSNKEEVRVLNTSAELTNFTAIQANHPFPTVPFQTWILGDPGNHGRDYNNTDSRCNTCHGNLDTKATTFSAITTSNGWCFRCHYGKTGPRNGYVDPIGLVANGIIKGTVTNASSTLPISGATVSADGQSDVTDVNGNYSISIAPGTYTLTATATGYDTASVSGVVVGSGATVVQNLAMQPSFVAVKTVTMPITIKHSKDIAGGTVNVKFNPAIVNVSSVTAGDFGEPTVNKDNANGSVFIAVAGTTAIGMNESVLASITFQGVGAGTSPLNLMDAELNDELANLITTFVTNGSITVDSSLNITGISPMVLDHQAPAVTNGTIKGKVTNATSSAPISGAKVTAGSQSNVTDGSGNYSISIIPGTYTVTANASGYNDGSTSGVVVTSGGTVVQNFAMTPKTIDLNGTIKGKVTNATSSVPISGAKVTAGSQSNVTDGSGNYSISIIPGTYTLTANASGYNDSSASGVIVTSGATVVQNFAMTPKPKPVSAFGASLTVNPTAQATRPGVIATYNLTLTNTGNTVDSYTLTFVNPDNAMVSLTQTSIQNLSAGASTNVLLNVTNTSASAVKFRVNVTATSQNDPSKNASVSTITTVLRANITAFKLDATGNRSGWITARVNVTNLNTTGDWFVIDVSGVAGDGSSLIGYPLVGTGTVWLNASGSAGDRMNDIPVLITIPPRAATGPYNLVAGIWKHSEFADPTKVITTTIQQPTVIS